MKQWISLVNRYSIYDYRNMCDIIGVDPDGRKRVRGRGIDANPKIADTRVSSATMLKPASHTRTGAA